MHTVEERTSVSGFPPRPSGAETSRRTLRLVTFLAARQPVGLDALAAETGLNKSTAYRLLRVLQEEGWAERVPGGYRLGGGFMSLAAQAVPDAPRFQTARPTLQKLSDLTGETVTLHRQAGDLGVLILGAENNRWPLRLVTAIGEALPLVRGCSGQAILAFLDPATAHAIVHRAGMNSEAEALERKLREIAGRGFATSYGSNHPGVRGIAAPVLPAASGAFASSVAISGPGERWTEDRALAFLPELQDTCTAVAHLLSNGTP